LKKLNDISESSTSLKKKISINIKQSNKSINKTQNNFMGSDKNKNNRFVDRSSSIDSKKNND